MNKGKKEIMKHIKDLTPGAMTVFVDFPFYMESHLKNFRFTRDDYSDFMSDDLTDLSLKGFCWAEDAVKEMTRIGLFFLLYEKELRQFYDEYNKAKKEADEELEAATQRTRSETDWRKHAPLIRAQFEVQKKVDSLFGNMYREWFGKCSPVLSEEGIDELKTICNDGQQYLP